MAKFAALIVLAFGVASAVPGGYSSNRPTSFKASSNGDNCICLEQTKTVTDGVTEGQYIYYDPVGGKVTVNYKYDVNGRYTEQRRVDKPAKFNKPVVTQVVTKPEPAPVAPALDSNTLIARIVAQLRPLIVRTIQQQTSNQITEKVTTTTTTSNSNSGSTSEFSGDLVVRLVTKLQSQIGSVVQTVLAADTAASNDQLTSSIIRRLEPKIQTVIQGENTGFSVAKIERLRQELVRRLTPVIRAAIDAFKKQQVEEQRQKEAQLQQVLFSNSFQGDVLVELQLQIESLVQSRLADRTRSAKLTLEQIADQIVAGLRPAIETAVQTTIEQQRITVSPQFYQSATYGQLLDKVLARVRLAVIDLVREIRAADAAVVDGAVSKVRSRLSSVVSNVVNSGESSSQRAIYTLVVSMLTESVIPDFLPADALSAQQTSWIQQILAQLESEIRREISRSLLAREANVVPDAVSALRTQISTLVSQVIADFGFEADFQTLYGYVVEEIRTLIRTSYVPQGATEAKVNSWIIQIIGQLRSVIENEIQTQVSAAQFQQTQALAAQRSVLRQELINLLIGRLQVKVGVVASNAAAPFQGSANFPSESQMIGTVRTAIRKSVVAAFRAETASSSSRFAILADQEDDIVASIMASLEGFIVQEVRNQIVILQQSVVVRQPAVTTVDKVTSLFGISGANTVKVQTPTHNYAYEH